MTETYNRTCPKCNTEITYLGGWAKYNCHTATKKNSTCKKCYERSGENNPFFGKHHLDKTKQQISLAGTGKIRTDEAKEKYRKQSVIRYSNPEEKKKTSKAVKMAMHRPDVRKRHIAGLHHSKWVKVRTDKGQLDFLEKWNRLGFRFEPNYQIHTDEDLFYIDGYDNEHNVVMEYDGTYHQKNSQQNKDRIRQKKIIDILNPKKFWRFDATTKQVTNVLGKVG